MWDSGEERGERRRGEKKRKKKDNKRQSDSRERKRKGRKKNQAKKIRSIEAQSTFSFIFYSELTLLPILVSFVHLIHFVALCAGKLAAPSDPQYIFAINQVSYLITSLSFEPWIITSLEFVCTVFDITYIQYIPESQVLKPYDQVEVPASHQFTIQQ
ncbi:hypothetical protein EYC80_005879 [Monilinia laxa]|uniref:Uncharacterized protein n=1 Tax=Monilinia laxa TaxID=61186 RepID=A0A5N6KFD9_MONLA|nr:hypothetical protein EYC80_005879 [Monilinia laxa]